MLKLKEPIQLHSIRPLLPASDGFAQRILGNYALLGAHITPKELLFALNSPPETPEEPAGMTTIAVQNNLSDQRTIVMDVVNNIVNRILLSQSSSFTYQDKIYLETALRKLGIEDVRLFLSQASHLQQENIHLRSLFELYQQERKRTESKPSETPSVSSTLTERPLHTDLERSTSESAQPLYQEIFRRLSTASIYQTMASYQNVLSSVSPVAEHRSLQLAEQSWNSQVLEVQQQYQNRHHHQEISLFHSVNRYETQGFPVLPQKEEQVLSQAAAAALFSSVTHVLTQRLSQNLRQEQVWQDLTQSLSETIENSLSRFETSYGGSLYYEYPSRTVLEQTVSESLLREIHKISSPGEEREGTNSAGSFPPSSEEAIMTGRIPEPSVGSEEFLPVRTEVPQTGETVESQEETLIRELYEIDRRNREKMEKLESLRFSTPSPTPAPVPDRKRIMSDALRAVNAPEEVIQEILELPPARTEYRTLSPEAEFFLSQADESTKEVLRTALFYQENPQAAIAEGKVHPGSLTQLNLENRTQTVTSEELTHRTETQQTLSGEEKPTFSLSEEIRKGGGKGSSGTPGDTPLPSLPLILKQESASVSGQNPTSPPSLGSDVTRTESVVSSLIHRSFQENESRSLHSSTENREQNTIQRGETRNSFLEEIRQAKTMQSPSGYHGKQIPPVHFVYKREAQAAPEENTELLQQKKNTVTQTENTSSSVTHRNVQESEIHSINTKTAVQSAEDIQALVNRTLSKQMNMITDRVYQKMEKRLETERFRRGRF